MPLQGAENLLMLLSLLGGTAATPYCLNVWILISCQLTESVGLAPLPSASRVGLSHLEALA